MDKEFNRNVIIGGILAFIASQIIDRYIERREQKKRMQQLRDELVRQFNKTKY